MKLSKNFDSDEFICKCCGKLPEDGINPELIDLLQAIRDKIDKPVVITPHGGYRCENQNKLSGGAKNSQHLFGNAADIKVLGMNARAVQHWLVANFNNQIGGMGCYSSFTHVDVRKGFARWSG